MWSLSLRVSPRAHHLQDEYRALVTHFRPEPPLDPSRTVVPMEYPWDTDLDTAPQRDDRWGHGDHYGGRVLQEHTILPRRARIHRFRLRHLRRRVLRKSGPTSRPTLQSSRQPKPQSGKASCLYPHRMTWIAAPILTPEALFSDIHLHPLLTPIPPAIRGMRCTSSRPSPTASTASSSHATRPDAKRA